MSKQKQQKSSNETVRVKVGKLARQDRDLMNAEAEDIRAEAAYPVASSATEEIKSFARPGNNSVPRI
jgi:hypothetical protein